MAGCSTCTRRALIKGIGASAFGSLILSACGGGSAAPDAATDSPKGSCPTGDTCLDTSTAQYSALANTGGSAVTTTSAGKLIVVRTGASSVAALSAICTHAGGTVYYSSGSMLLVCPIHGAEFSLNGSVVLGPATTALKTYNASVSGNVIEIVTG